MPKSILIIKECKVANDNEYGLAGHCHGISHGGGESTFDTIDATIAEGALAGLIASQLSQADRRTISQYQGSIGW